ncbi:hypothetical protein N7486_000682 [Penicillium sp. IBT 16267x]|nr:hypothetical protein N7486_000682 [Penicillium sp. IBT 16267x]
MATPPEPEVIVYDMVCTKKNVCFLPGVWSIRLMLSYKKVAFKTVFLEYSDIKTTLKGFGFSPVTGEALEKLPAIKHVATNKCIMFSSSIYKFLESTYPDPPLPICSQLGRAIEWQINEAALLAYSKLIIPSLPTIFSQRTKQAMGNKPGEQEHPTQSAVDMEENADFLKDKMCDLMEVMLNHQTNGPFLMGAQPCHTDFYLVAMLACAKVVDKGAYKRLAKYPLFGKPYEACLLLMENKD